MARSFVQRLGRLVRHRLRDERDTARAIPADLAARLAARVAEGEKRHTGEVRVSIEAALPTSYVMRDSTPRERAIALFGKLRVWDTQDNNGVLIYLLLAEHAIEVVADRGVTARVPGSEWTRLVEAISMAFRAGRYEEGLTRAIDDVTELLVQHFPVQAGKTNPNELPDEPALG